MVTTIVAIYAAVIATIGLAWNVYSIVRDRPRIKIQVSFGHVVDSSGRGPTQVVFQASNVGRRPVILTGVGFILPKVRSKNLGMMNALWDFPHKVDEGERYDCPFELEVLQQEIAKLGLRSAPKRCWFSDATGRYHKGKVPNAISNLLAK